MPCLETIHSPYNQAEVWETEEGVMLEVAGACHACYHPNHLLTGYSWDALTSAALYPSCSRVRTILLLGLGGGTMVRQLRRLLPHAHITALEIDPEMVRVARQYMNLKPEDAEVVLGDAYDFLQRSRATYDVILDDVYQATPDDVERPWVVEGSLLDRMKARLNPGGVAGINLVLGAGHRRVQSRVRKAFKSAFAEVRSIRPPLGYNEILVGGDALLSPAAVKQQASVFTHAGDQATWRRLRSARLT